jgi:hypothetical protein
MVSALDNSLEIPRQLAAEYPEAFRAKSGRAAAEALAVDSEVPAVDSEVPAAALEAVGEAAGSAAEEALAAPEREEAGAPDR